MNKYKRFIPIALFIVLVALLIAAISFGCVYFYNEYTTLKQEEQNVQQTLDSKRSQKARIEKKIRDLIDARKKANKKVYAPDESQQGNDTLFFTLYSDLIEMVNSNSIKIDSIEYKYITSGDKFVEQGDMFFVCDVNLKLVSNYINLGQLIQDIYQYNYYMKINSIDIYPYQKDKKVLLTSMSVRLYAHTQTEEEYLTSEFLTEENAVEGASTPIPQE